jgi:hypothetical protein
MGGSDSEAPVFVEFILPPFEMLFGERPKHTSYIILYHCLIYIILNHPVHCLLSTAGEWQQLMINETVRQCQFPTDLCFQTTSNNHVLNICTTTADRMDTYGYDAHAVWTRDNTVTSRRLRRARASQPWLGRWKGAEGRNDGRCTRYRAWDIGSMVANVLKQLYVNVCMYDSMCIYILYTHKFYIIHMHTIIYIYLYILFVLYTFYIILSYIYINTLCALGGTDNLHSRTFCHSHDLLWFGARRGWFPTSLRWRACSVLCRQLLWSAQEMFQSSRRGQNDYADDVTVWHFSCMSNFLCTVYLDSICL